MANIELVIQRPTSPQGQGFERLILLDNGDGSFTFSVKSSADGNYLSNPAQITAGSPIFVAGGIIGNPVIIKPSVDSLTAIQLQTAGGTTVLDVDTTNKRVGINNNAPAAAFHVGSVATPGALEVTPNANTFAVFDGGGGDIALSNFGGNMSIGDFSPGTLGINVNTTLNGNASLTLAGGPLTLNNNIISATISDAATNALTKMLDLIHGSSGTPAAGFGASIRIGLQDSTTANQDAGLIYGKWTTATHASRTSQVSIQTVNNGGVLTDSLIVAPLSATVAGALNLGSFAGDPAAPVNGGLWYDSTNNLLRARINGASVSLGGSGSGVLTQTLSDAATNSVSKIVDLIHNTSGTPAAGYGESLRFGLQDSTTANQDAGLVYSSWTTATHATRSSQVAIQAVDQAAALADVAQFSFQHNGGTPVAQIIAVGNTGQANVPQFTSAADPVNTGLRFTASAAFFVLQGNDKVQLVSAGVIADAIKLDFTNADVGLARVSAGVARISNGGAAMGAVLYKELVSIKTANYPLVINDSGTVFSNAGAGGEVDFTLPTAAAGLTYVFIVEAAQILKVIAGAATTIRLAGSVSAAAGNITNATIGGTVRLTATSATTWLAEYFQGTWTVT